MQQAQRSTPKRAQQERALKTQVGILDAAVSILTEEGYSRATTLRIQERAGVSRGRLLHHFPSRDELLTAAVHRLVTVRMDALTHRKDWPIGEGERIDAAVQTMWATHQQSYFWASSELWLAARHNEQLRAALEPQERVLARLILSTVETFFGHHLASRAGYSELVRILLSSMRGVAMTYALHDRKPETEPELATWKSLARTLLKQSN